MFRNEPATDFSVEANRNSFNIALAKIDRQISQGLHACPIIDGKNVEAGEEVASVDPSSPKVVVARVRFASLEDTKKALQTLRAGARGWAAQPFEARAEVIKKVAERMRQERYDLAALIVREAGKPWKEADGDVAEAIDFCDYYANEMLRLGPPRLTYNVMGEENLYFYQPRGVCAVIAPWNFPLAIACGMTVAALVTGNATVLKPSEQTSMIAFVFSKILLECGVPANAYAFLPGRGEIVGRELVRSADTDMICFTGSKAVGLEIITTASEVQPGQRNIKKVIAELGGKNAIIVDEDADLDEAVKGVMSSAFGFAGQKCSACARAIIVGDAYETFLHRLCEAASDISVGLASDPSSFLGPVIDEDSHNRIMQTIARAEKENKLAFKGKVPAEGYFVPPTVFRDVEAKRDLWNEEIFGPVLACQKVGSFEEALEVANNSQYALTGGLFSRSPRNIALAREAFKVGNLYINRGCTGALVCRQPFGGFKMSGVGSKAGGPDYLLQFVEPRTVTENTMRRGFAPNMA